MRGDAWARWVCAALSCAVMVALAGCSGNAKHSAAPAGTGASSAASPGGGRTASTAAKPSPDVVRPVAPLTGLTVTAAIAQRPAVAVAVASPALAGLGSADVIFEEITSPVRFLAVFQSNEASLVGPVTSTRPTDGQVLSVLHPLASYDGGTSAFISVLDATKVVDDGYAGHASLYSSGSAGLTVSTVALAAAGRSDGPPPPLFSYRAPGTSLASTQETHPTSVQVSIPGQPAEQWNFDSQADRWVETAGGPRVSVANVIIQIVSFRSVYLSRRYGLTTQSAQVIGSGQATIFSGAAPGQSGGTAASGTWYKPGLAAVTNYFDAAHALMNFVPGPTFVVLTPAGTRISQVAG
jgi:hypothetical protein